MPADLLQSSYHHNTGSHSSSEQHMQILAHHGSHSATSRWGTRNTGPHGEQGEGVSLNAFVETRLVPMSLSQIPNCLPDHVSPDGIHDLTGQYASAIVVSCQRGRILCDN